jgi:PhnB protein
MSAEESLRKTTKLMTITPYIMFNGNCEAALNFYTKAFGGEIKHLQRFEGSPAEDMSADKQKVMHAHFEAKGILFMASDGQEHEANGGMIHLSINFEAAGEIDTVFNVLCEGANIAMPLQDTFWGARFGMLTDRFGVNWMLNYDKPKSS